jgi:hypothetical protein
MATEKPDRLAATQSRYVMSVDRRRQRPGSFRDRSRSADKPSARHHPQKDPLDHESEASGIQEVHQEDKEVGTKRSSLEKSPIKPEGSAGSSISISWADSRKRK